MRRKAPAPDAGSTSLLLLVGCLLPRLAQGVVCEAGTSVQPTSSGFECRPCANGTFQEEQNKFYCKFCPVGYWSGLGQRACAGCPPGFFRDTGEGCSSCAAGMYSDLDRQTKCTSCSTGLYSSADHTVCASTCSKGMYANVSIQACVHCPQGQFGQSTRGNQPCKACPRGLYVAAIGKLSCEACPSAKYSSAGQRQCKDCVAGLYEDGNASHACKVCPTGMKSVKASASCLAVCAAGFFTSGQACINCPAGRYSAVDNTFCGLHCPAGFAPIVRGAPACALCPAGYYGSLVTGGSTCELCPGGRYGAVQGLNTSLCTGVCRASFFCPAGSVKATQVYCGDGYNSAAGAASNASCTEKRRCPPGKGFDADIWRASGSHDLACIDCAPGLYKAAKGDVKCDPCQRGTYNDATGQSECTQCGLGQYIDLVGSRACKICSQGRYGATLGAPSADECALCARQIPNSVTLESGRTSIDDCVCSIGHMMVEKAAATAATTGKKEEQTQQDTTKSEMSSSRRSCKLCPRKGANCDARGSTLRELPIRPGYWRASADSTIIHLCKNPAACIGSYNSSRDGVASAATRPFPDALCRIGHGGPLCSICVSGWAQLDSPLCVDCTGASIWPLLRAIGLLLMMIVSVFGIFYCWYKRAGRRALSVAGLATIAHHALPTWLLKLKILISFLQVAGSLQITFHVPFPTILLSVLAVFDFLNFPFKYFSIGCVVARDYYTDLQAITIIPLFIAIGIYCRYRWMTLEPLRVPYDKANPLEWMEARNKVNQIFGTHFGYFAMLLYFIYPGVTANLFGVFQTQQYEDGRFYLLNDMSIERGSAKYAEMQGFAILFIFIYPIGIPFFIWFVLWRDKAYYWNKPDTICTYFPQLCAKYHMGHKAAIGDNGQYRPTKVEPDNAGVLRSQEFLIGAYKQKYWWFELFELFRKLLLTGLFCVILPGTDEQIALATLACLGAFFVYVNWKPYRLKSDNSLAIFSLFGLFLLMYVGLIVKLRSRYTGEVGSRANETTGEAALFGVLLVGMTMFFPVGGLLMIIHGIVRPERDPEGDRRMEMLMKGALAVTELKAEMALKFGDNRPVWVVEDSGSGLGHHHDGGDDGGDGDAEDDGLAFAEDEELILSIEGVQGIRLVLRDEFDFEKALELQEQESKARTLDSPSAQSRGDGDRTSDDVRIAPPNIGLFIGWSDILSACSETQGPDCLELLHLKIKGAAHSSKTKGSSASPSASASASPSPSASANASASTSPSAGAGAGAGQGDQGKGANANAGARTLCLEMDDAKGLLDRFEHFEREREELMREEDERRREQSGRGNPDSPMWLPRALGDGFAARVAAEQSPDTFSRQMEEEGGDDDDDDSGGRASPESPLSPGARHLDEHRANPWGLLDEIKSSKRTQVIETKYRRNVSLEEGALHQMLLRNKMKSERSLGAGAGGAGTRRGGGSKMKAAERRKSAHQPLQRTKSNRVRKNTLIVEDTEVPETAAAAAATVAAAAATATAQAGSQQPEHQQHSGADMGMDEGLELALAISAAETAAAEEAMAAMNGSGSGSGPTSTGGANKAWI